MPPIARNKSGHQVYLESDVKWIFLIRCMRDTDMPIAKIKQYVSLLVRDGGESIPQKRDILREHSKFLTRRIRIFQNRQELIEKKIEFYGGHYD